MCNSVFHCCGGGYLGACTPRGAIEKTAAAATALLLAVDKEFLGWTLFGFSLTNYLKSQQAAEILPVRLGGVFPRCRFFLQTRAMCTLLDFLGM